MSAAKRQYASLHALFRDVNGNEDRKEKKTTKTKKKKKEQSKSNDQDPIVALYVYGRDFPGEKEIRIHKDQLGKVGISIDTELSASIKYVVASKYCPQEKLVAWLSNGGFEYSKFKVKTVHWFNCMCAQRDFPGDDTLGDFDWEEERAKIVIEQQASMSSVEYEDNDWRLRIPKAYRKTCEKFETVGEILGLTPVKEDAKSQLMCQKSGTLDPPTNVNKQITDILDFLAGYYKVVNETWRAVGYKKASNILKGLQFEVTHPNEVKDIRGIGSKMLLIIGEILKTGKSKLKDSLENSSLRKALESLCQVHGIGPGLGSQLYARGICTIKDLRESDMSRLPSVVKCSLPYVEDLQNRIPRSEVEEIGAYVQNVAKQVWSNKNVSIQVCGSYRRGKETSGDVDFLICTPGLDGCPRLLELLEALHKRGFLVQDLVDTRSKAKAKHTDIGNGQVAGKQSYMGICKLEGKAFHRRIDIKVYPAKNFGFAMLYFTGSDHFNRSMRYYAKVSGYSMDDTGLYKALRHGKDKVAKATESLIQCQTEKQVFDALGLEYRGPTDRNCYEYVGRPPITNKF
eukprot:CAMPEP_0203750548 /NCGR_PEP_ID=MMETSP0098-20131031/4766_1 /ASSEMBLY_ACC=CAM_ASM_000208 /TAXON_ID=96639 /ORGANISM=" , Strain NY0313808BC1" /LENGTH=569 /DNA_ID=CAMNT_0050639903 /DNA_START=121 /DNA_END=1830 /DNA_ORIENTATION=+